MNRERSVEREWTICERTSYCVAAVARRTVVQRVVAWPPYFVWQVMHHYSPATDCSIESAYVVWRE